jgi:hypothetical protein
VSRAGDVGRGGREPWRKLDACLKTAWFATNNTTTVEKNTQTSGLCLGCMGWMAAAALPDSKVARRLFFFFFFCIAVDLDLGAIPPNAYRT